MPYLIYFYLYFGEYPCKEQYQNENYEKIESMAFITDTLFYYIKNKKVW